MVFSMKNLILVCVLPNIPLPKAVTMQLYSNLGDLYYLTVGLSSEPLPSLSRLLKAACKMQLKSSTLRHIYNVFMLKMLNNILTIRR